MPRPFKYRRVCCRPDADYFKPRGIPLDCLEEIHLTMDEMEAVRLADFDGLYQEEAAGKMNISRQTFGNIINAAHKKIADALLNAKALKIEGGMVKMAEDGRSRARGIAARRGRCGAKGLRSRGGKTIYGKSAETT